MSNEPPFDSLRAYADRLMSFIIDHIGRPYDADEAGHVLELRPDDRIEPPFDSRCRRCGTATHDTTLEYRGDDGYWRWTCDNCGQINWHDD